MDGTESISKGSIQWQKTQYANLIRYVPSGAYFARIRVKGKLIRKSLKTDSITVAKLRLADLEKAERQKADTNIEIAGGKLTFGQALAIYRSRTDGDVSLKQRTKDYYADRSAALLKSWPDLAAMDIARISKLECLNWAATLWRSLSQVRRNLSGMTK